MGAFHRWWSWESGAHGHAYLSPFMIHSIKGHFTLRPSVERKRDFSNLIGGEQKSVYLAFILEANRQKPPKRLYGNTFWKF
jgi:hypothetical protein